MTSKQKPVSSVATYDAQYTPHYFTGTHGTLSYRRVGTAKRVLVLLHGNPTWSFLYRNMLPYLRAYTVIVPDLLGYGYSYKPTSPSKVQLQSQVAALHELLEYLLVKDPVFVGQDWGGPIATLLAGQYKSKKIILLNTYPPGMLPFNSLLRTFLGTRVAKFFVVQADIFRKIAFKKGFYAPLQKEVVKGYLLPHALPKSRLAVWALPAQLRSMRAQQGTVQLIDSYITSKAVSVLVVWGVHDSVFAYKKVLQTVSALPNVQFMPIQNAGHYVQEDAPKQVAAHITAWLS